MVRVKVLEVDIKRKRIALTMRLNDQAAPKRSNSNDRTSSASRQPAKPAKVNNPPSSAGNAFAEAFARAKKKV